MNQFATDANVDMAPPSGRTGIIGWMRRNLFSTWYNSLLTVVLVYVLVTTLVPFFDWAVLDATFSGASQENCTGGGACWLFLKERFAFFIYGFYPDGLHWRVNIVFAMLAICFVPQMLPRFPAKKWLGIAGFTVLPVVGFILIRGDVFGLEFVRTGLWGGLMLTLVLAYGGMVLALPIGVFLALGRRSKMTVIRGFSTIFIEVWRGVPLITVLFMASVMFPLFMPTGVTIDKLLRAYIGLTLFYSTYMAEVVRGGLQAIPNGQYEAADALGLGYWRKMGLVILPQSLKVVIPGIVNTQIALFKDTTLVLIIGLFDILGTVQATIMDPAWSNVSAEAYLFVAFSFWIFTFSMSRYSQGLERKLKTEN